MHWFKVFAAVAALIVLATLPSYLSWARRAPGLSPAMVTICCK
jgi:hypothetical protein